MSDETRPDAAGAHRNEDPHGIDTRIVHVGRDPFANHGIVNPPVHHASTVLFPDTKTMLSGAQTYHYARRGNPTTNALEDAVQVRTLLASRNIRAEPWSIV